MPAAALLALSLLLLAVPPASAAASTEAGVVIESIEAEGMTGLGAAELQSVLELGVGDEFVEARARRSADGLADLYRYRGFPEARVSSRFDRGAGIWSLSVDEGAPLRIARIRIEALESNGLAARPGWQRIEAALRSRFALFPGEIFDREKATAGARALQSALVDEEYIGAAVGEVLIEREKAAPDPVPAVAAGKTASGWVSLRIRVEPGEKVGFGFRGNRFLSRNDLLALVREQRALGLGANYLETLRVRFVEAYRAAGFTQASVTAFPVERPGSEGRHVTWVIDEGIRSRIESIDFDGGVALSRAELGAIFREGVGGSIPAGIYVEKDLERAVEVFVQKLRSRGYLGSRLLSLQTQWNADHSRASILVFIFEGEQTRVDSIDVTGASGVDPVLAARLLGVSVGEPLNLFAFSEGIQRLKQHLRDQGHLEAGIVGEGGDTLVRYRDGNRLADIRIEVEPGPVYRSGSISVEGLSKTRREVVLRELLFREGDLLTGTGLLESESRLRRLGLFSTVQIRTEPDPDQAAVKKIHVFVQEGTPGLVAGGAGFRNDLGARVFGQTSYSNLFGRNHTVVFSINANRRFVERRVPVESQAQLGYIWPWFVIPELTFRPTVTFQNTQYEKFDAVSLVLGGTLERRLLKRPNLIASLGYSLERTEQNALDPLSIDNQTITIGAITGSLRMDLRDDPLAPTRGFYAGVSYEIADPSLLSQRDPFPIGYTRFQFRSDYLLPVWRNASWYFSFRTGIERNTQDISDPRVAIPLIKQFTLGGVGSLRGFKEQELNIQDIAIRGTASYVNYRAQFDIPLSGPLRFGPFFDAANLLVDDYSLNRNLRMGTGAGLHYLTPVGPVNFDLGFKIRPRPGEDPYRFYFSIGVI